MTNQGINIYNLVFLLAILLSVVFYFKGFEGILFSDDFSYAYYASELQQGRVVLNEDIFSHRIGLYAPVAFLYMLWGVNDLTTTLYPLTCFLATAFLIYRLLRKEDALAATAAGALWCLAFYPLFFSNKLFPDVIVAFFAFASSVVLYHRKEGTSGQVVKGLSFCLLFFWGFLVKETMLYLLPFFAFVFIRDKSNRTSGTFWMAAISGLLLLTVLYLSAYYCLCGDPLYRFRVIQEGHYISGYSYFDKPWPQVLARITYRPFQMLVASEMWIPVLFAVPWIVARGWNNDGKDKSFWLPAAAVFLAAFWFGTTSLKYYNPITINPRMFIPVIPFWAVAGGRGFSYLLSRGQGKPFYLFGTLLLLSPAMAWYFDAPKQVPVYGLLALLILFLTLIKKRLPPFVPVLMLMAVLFVHPAFSMMKSSGKNFKASEDIVTKVIPALPGAVTVVTDPGLARGYLYFYRFRPPRQVTFVHYKYLDSVMHSGKTGSIYALVNEKHVSELSDMGYKVPAAFLHPPQEWKPVKKEEGVGLYLIKSDPARR